MIISKCLNNTSADGGEIIRIMRIVIPVIIAIVASVIAGLMGVLTYTINSRMIKRRQEVISVRIEDIISKTISFTTEMLASYRQRMICSQPIDNDRILPGRGKNHTLNCIASVTEQGSPIPSVIGLIGDTFS